MATVAGEAFNVLHDGVAVLGVLGEAGENEQYWVDHVITYRVISYRVIRNASRARVRFVGDLCPRVARY